MLSGDEWRRVFGLDGSDFVQRAKDGGMLDAFARVFAGFDGGFEVGFGDRDPDLGGLLNGSCGKIGDTDFDAGGV